MVRLSKFNLFVLLCSVFVSLSFSQGNSGFTGKWEMIPLIHIREYSDLQRTKNILDRLGKDFEVVPLDIFLKLASVAPTFEERYLKN